MKSLLTISSCFWSLLLVAQSSKAILYDSSIVNQCFKQAYSMLIEYRVDNSTTTLLTKAATLSEAHPNQNKKLEIKGLQALTLVIQSQYQQGAILAQQLIQQDNKSLSSLKFAYWAMHRYHLSKRQHASSLAYANKALAVTSQHTADYFLIVATLLEDLDRIIDLNFLNNLIQNLEITITTNPTFKWYQPILYHAKMLYYEQAMHHEKAIIYAKNYCGFMSKSTPSYQRYCDDLSPSWKNQWNNA